MGYNEVWVKELVDLADDEGDELWEFVQQIDGVQTYRSKPFRGASNFILESVSYHRMGWV